MTQLRRVDRAVNGEFEPVGPIQDPADGFWDCENYALEKKARLIAAGWPQDALRLWAVKTPRREDHAVLVAYLPDGSAWVLDNLAAPRPLKFARADYGDWRPMWLTRNPPAHP